MELVINKDLLFTLKQNDLFIEDYFVLKCIKEDNHDFLDIWDNMFKDKHTVIIYNKLIINNFIELDSSEKKDIFVLTQKGKQFFENELYSN